MSNESRHHRHAKRDAHRVLLHYDPRRGLLPVGVLGLCPPQSSNRIFCGARPSGLQKELHLYAGEFDDVMVMQLMGLRVKRLAIDHREVRALDVGNEVPLGPFGDNGNLNAGFADRRQRFTQRQLLAGVRTGQELNHPLS
jgi:hypothetical protein